MTLVLTGSGQVAGQVPESGATEPPMMEIPEVSTLARQAARTLVGRTITEVEAAHSPHRLTGYTGDPAGYPALLTGRELTGARASGGHLELEAGDLHVVLNDGAVPLLLPAGRVLPARHQLRLGLDDGRTLVVVVAMYGGIQLVRADQAPDRYLDVARRTPSPLTPAFDRDHFDGLLAAAPRALSAKGLLATGQRIPGLGNGSLQDVLWNARLHPRRKVASLSDDEHSRLFAAVTATLQDMTRAGGRDTEKDLVGDRGGYRTALSRTTLELPCRRCGGTVRKEAYLGGAVYWCTTCQPL